MKRDYREVKLPSGSELISSWTLGGQFDRTAIALLEDGSVKTIASWSTFDIDFTESDFIGRTQKEVDALYLERRDVTFNKRWPREQPL